MIYRPWKTNFSFEWVNTLEKKSLQETVESKEETKKELDQWKEKKEIIRKIEFSDGDERQEYVQYAYQLGGLDLVLLIECENATRNMYRQSEVVKNGRREPSYGFCMIDRDFHQKIVDDQRFWSDRRRQMEKCHELRKGGTKFYWPWRYIAKAGKKCSDYVRDRFIIE